MSYIYCITNKINGKKYVGQTSLSIDNRWKDHIKDSIRFDRPLYRAIRKYGRDNFLIELLEDTPYPNDREIFWIKKLGTYSNGYNATVGGEGRPFLDYEKIISTYNKTHNIKKVAKKLGCSQDQISRILKDNNIDIFSGNSKQIIQYSLDGRFIRKHNSATEAALFLNKGKAKAPITACARGERKTAYGYIWKYTP